VVKLPVCRSVVVQSVVFPRMKQWCKSVHCVGYFYYVYVKEGNSITGIRCELNYLSQAYLCVERSGCETQIHL
jgi:hypothetical protein